MASRTEIRTALAADCLKHCKTAFDRPAVYEHELLAAGLSAETCLTDKTTNSNFGEHRAVHFDQTLQQFDAVQVPDPIAERGGSR